MAKEHELGIKFTSDGADKVEKQIEDIADAAEKLDGEVEVEVTADTRDAETRIAKFEREVDGLTDDARELRIEYRAQTIEREIKKTLRELDKLEDPVDIEAKSGDLERAQKDLKDLAELAERKYEIDIKADTKQATRGVKDLTSAVDDGGAGALKGADRYQSLGSSVRGVSDELGVASSGVNSFAIGALDAGDVAVQMGEKFGLSAKAAAGLGTALGAAGIGAVIAGTAVPAILSLINSQEKLNEETKEASERISEQLGLLENFDEFAEETGLITEALFGDLDDDQLTKFAKFTESLGTTIPAALTKLEAAGGDFAPVLKDLFQDDAMSERIKQLGEQFGVTGDEIADAAAKTDDWLQFRRELGVEGLNILGSKADQDAAFKSLRELFDQIELGQDIVDEIDYGKAFKEQAIQIKQGGLGEAAATQFKAIADSMPGADDSAVVTAFFDQVNADTRAAADIAAREADRLNAARAEGMYLAEQFEGQVVPAIAAVNADLQGFEDIDGPEIMVDAALAQFDRLVDGIDSDVARLKFERELDAKFKKVAEAQAKADQDIANNGWEGASGSVRDHMIKLGELRSLVGRYQRDILELPAEVITELTPDLDDASVRELEEYLKLLQQGIKIPISIINLGNINSGNYPAYPVSVDPDSSNTRGMSLDTPITASSSAYRTRGIGVASVQNVTINVPNGLNLRNVNDTLSRWQRINGGRL